jgi:hypothetical protein
VAPSRKRKPAAPDPDTVLQTHCPASDLLIKSALQLADSPTLQHHAGAHISTLLHKLKASLSTEIVSVVRNSYAVGKAEQRDLTLKEEEGWRMKGALLPYLEEELLEAQDASAALRAEVEELKGALDAARERLHLEQKPWHDVTLTEALAGGALMRNLEPYLDGVPFTFPRSEKAKQHIYLSPQMGHVASECPSPFSLPPSWASVCHRGSTIFTEHDVFNAAANASLEPDPNINCWVREQQSESSRVLEQQVEEGLATLDLTSIDEDLELFGL